MAISSFQKNYNKKGVLIGEVIFIILNLAFFSLLILGTRNLVGGANMKEKVLAKEIALFINAAKPGTTIEINIADYKKIADNNKIIEFIKIENNKVKVTLAGEGFSYPFVSTYKVENRLDGNFLVMEVKNA